MSKKSWMKRIFLQATDSLWQKIKLTLSKNKINMCSNEMTEEEIRKLAETRKQIMKKNASIFADWDNEMARQRKETLKLMRRRHAYYTKLIADAKIKTAQDFYDRYKEHFEMYGIELKLSDDKSWCTIYLDLGDYDYEDYSIGNGVNGGLAVVSTEVSFKEMFNNRVYIN